MTSPEEIKKANLFRVVFIGVCFTTLFTAYIAAQNLVSQLYGQLGYSYLGQTCLFTYFGLFALGSTFAAHYKKKISVKTGLIFGAAGHISFVFAGAFTTFCSKNGYEEALCSPSFISFFNILCASFLGIGASFIWLCQATYVDECADEQTKGLFNGIFWSIYQVAQITSSALATFLLGSTDQFTFYSILLLFGIGAIVLMTFIKPPVDNGSRKPQQQAVSEETLTEALTSFYEVLKEKNCYFLYLGIFFSGIAIGCYISFLGAAAATTIDSTNENEINQSIGFVFIVLSCGEVAAGLSVGRLADIYDKLKLFNITMILNEVALGLTILACAMHSYTLAIICGLFWGYADTAIQTMINAVIGSMFGGRAELFSAYRFFQGLGLMCSALLTILVPRDEPIIYLLIIACIFAIFHFLNHVYLPGGNRGSQDQKGLDGRAYLEMKDI